MSERKTKDGSTVLAQGHGAFLASILIPPTSGFWGWMGFSGAWGQTLLILNVFLANPMGQDEGVSWLAMGAGKLLGDVCLASLKGLDGKGRGDSASW